MAKTLTLETKKRDITGKKVKQLRKQDILPANLFGKGIESIALQLPFKTFTQIFKEAGETQVIELHVEGEKKTYPAIISNIQLNPINLQPIHADFRFVDLTEKITASIPVELTGEAPAEKLGGIIFQSLDTIEVEALPGDLPEKIELDISVLTELSSSLAAKDLKLGSKIELKIDPETPVVNVQEPKTQEEPEEETAADDAEESTEEGAAEEGSETKVDSKEDKKE